MEKKIGYHFISSKLCLTFLTSFTTLFLYFLALFFYTIYIKNRSIASKVTFQFAADKTIIKKDWLGPMFSAATSTSRTSSTQQECIRKRMKHKTTGFGLHKLNGKNILIFIESQL